MMSQSKWKLLLIVGAVLLGSLALDVSPAQAQYYGFWQRGPVRRVFAFAVSPWVMAWRNYSTGYGYRYRPYFVATPGYGGYMASCDGTPVCAVAQPLERGTGSLVLNVPESAKVYINGEETVSTGTTRRYFSRGLLAEKRYKYDIRVVDERNGEAVEETKTVYLAGGNRSEMSFALASGRTEAVMVSARRPTTETTLKLRVPADAKIALGGNATTIEGAERIYRTSKLPAGQAWEGYTIRATIERGGRELVAERTITLTGGETREVVLDFSPPRVAQR
jgi:uncharacterized protein (TIGR03000 family)